MPSAPIPFYDPEGEPCDPSAWGEHFEHRWLINTDVAGHRITSTYLGIDQRFSALSGQVEARKPWIYGTIDRTTDFERFDSCQADAEARHQAFVAWVKSNVPGA